MNTLVIITIICCFVSFAFAMISFTRFDLFNLKKRKLFANYYSLTSPKEIKQKQKESLNEIFNGSFDLRKKYRFISVIHRIVILSILVDGFCFYFTIIWNLGILFILSVGLFCFSLILLYTFLSQKINYLLYLYIKNNDLTSIEFKKENINTSDISFIKNNYFYRILSLMMSISFLFLLMILAYLDGA